MKTSIQIAFEVYYRRGEYVTTVSEYVLFRRNQKMRRKSPETALAASRLPWYDRITISLVAPLALRYKLRKLGTCAFDIDEHRIQRTSKLGVLCIPWRELIAVHRLSQAYLFEKARGAVPVPYRCLSATQVAALDDLIRGKEAELQRES
jgi:hypothetical protein